MREKIITIAIANSATVKVSFDWSIRALPPVFFVSITRAITSDASGGKQLTILWIDYSRFQRLRIIDRKCNDPPVAASG